MPLPFSPGGRVYAAGPTHAIMQVPTGRYVFGRVRGNGLAVWDFGSLPTYPELALRNLPASPCYNGCCCPEDTELLIVTELIPTWVLGSIFEGSPCNPCDVYTGPCVCDIPGLCVPCGEGSVCAECDPSCGNALGGNIQHLPMSGLVGWDDMEAVGFTADALTGFANAGFSGDSIPSVTLDVATFPGNGDGLPGGYSPPYSNLENQAGGQVWVGNFGGLHVAVVAGVADIPPNVPGWTPVMLPIPGSYGLIQVFAYTADNPELLGSPLPVIGHAANCNAYPPIPSSQGSTSAPGNGLLAGDPTAGTIPVPATGAGLPYSAGSIAPGLAAMYSWARANGISAALCQDSQRSAKDVLDELLTVGNSAPVYSGDELKIIPYDEVSWAGFGAVYIAPTASGPVANLGDQDFVSDGKTPPVKFTRKRRADCDNVASIEFIDRALDYAHNVVSFPVQGAVALYGPRKGGTLDAADLGMNIPSGAKALLSISNAPVAQAIASILSKRSAAGANQYEFTLKQEWLHLEAMDLVTISDSRLGLASVAVRLTSVKETAKRELACTAEKFIYGLNHPSLKAVTAATGSLVKSSIDPGPVNAPIIFQPPVSMLPPGTPPQVWILVSGADPNYGGCVGFVSVDGGASYPTVLGRLGPATTGELTADFPNAADPDTVDTLAVDLTESLGEISSQSAAIANGFADPCYVAGATAPAFETVCPTVATLTSAYHYSLGTLIRRAVQGTLAMDHPTGSRFGVMNGALFKVDLPPQWVGVTLYLKFAAFNLTGGQQNDLSACVPYTFTPVAELLPGDYYIN